MRRVALFCLLVSSSVQASQFVVTDSEANGPANKLYRYMEYAFNLKAESPDQFEVDLAFDADLILKKDDEQYSIIGPFGRPFVVCIPHSCQISSDFSIENNSFKFQSLLGKILPNLIGPFPKNHEARKQIDSAKRFVIPGIEGLTLLCTDLTYSNHCVGTGHGAEISLDRSWNKKVLLTLP